MFHDVDHRGLGAVKTPGSAVHAMAATAGSARRTGALPMRLSLQSGMLEVFALMALAAPSPIEARIAARLSSFAGAMGVAAVHLDTGETIAVAADDRFPTASAIKTAVMVEVFHQIAAGRIRKDQLVTLTDEVKVGGSGVLHSLRAGGQHSVADLLYLMIALSDNTATNMLVALVGTKAVDDRMVAYGLPTPGCTGRPSGVDMPTSSRTRSASTAWARPPRGKPRA